MLNFGRAKPGDKPTSKFCSDCHKRKDVSLFHTAKGGVLNCRAECKSCSKIRLMKADLKKRRMLKTTTQFAHATLSAPMTSMVV
jgi:hypothetical protein